MPTFPTDYISIDATGEPRSFVGPLAVKWHGVVGLRAAIKMYKEAGIIPTHGVGITLMMRSATAITGKSYKRGQYDAAIADLTTWIQATLPTIPVIKD